MTLALNNPGAITSGALWVGSNSTLAENADNAISGTAALTVSYGGGTPTLSRANNYTGPTTIYTGGNNNTGALLLDFSQPWSPVSNIINNGLSHANIANGSALVLAGCHHQFHGQGQHCQHPGVQRPDPALRRGQPGPHPKPGANGGSMLVAVNGITRQVGSGIAFNAATGSTGISTTTTNTDFTSAGGQQTILGGWATVGQWLGRQRQQRHQLHQRPG